MPLTHTPPATQFTDAAIAQAREFIEQRQNPALKLRVFVSGGGCAGFQYGFSFDEKQNDDDTLIDKDGVSILIDSLSAQYLDGAEIDFIDNLSGSRFVVDNPNAVTTCGCDDSFTI